MRRKAEVFLLDIWQASDYILRRTSEIDLTEYLRNDDIRFAIERNFIIIGEAASNLRDHYPAVGNRVDELPAIVAFRHFIIHHYWSINDEAVWEIITRNLESFRHAIATLLNEYPPPA